METRWPESHGSSGRRMASVVIKAAGHVEAESGNLAQSSESRLSSHPNNGIAARQTAALASGFLGLIVAENGSGTWAWKLFRKGREDDEDTDVEEDADGGTGDGGNGPTRTFHSRDGIINITTHKNEVNIQRNII